MKLEYNLGRYSLKVLNKSHSIDVLDFYYRNRRDFDMNQISRLPSTLKTLSAACLRLK
jgi:hypothetical protein